LLEQVLAPTYSIIASIACHEKRHGGNFHLHLALILNKKCNIINESYLDIGSFHGNYTSARNWNASVNYIKKCYKNTTASPTAYEDAITSGHLVDNLALTPKGGREQATFSSDHLVDNLASTSK